MQVFLLLVGVVLIFLLAGWLGLQIKPASFSAFPQRSLQPEIIPLPANLPPPVERFYRQLYGERVPVVTSAVMTGRGTLRLPSRGGIAFPGRFRFTHQAGQGYHHYIEVTWFGFPLLKVNEHYLNSQSRFELPFGVTENKPKVNQGANLALWAESAFWLPSILVTDPRVRWEPVDELSAALFVPFGKTEERFAVHFDPDTGLLKSMESMRYHEATSSAKTLWRNEALAWKIVEGFNIAVMSALTWEDEGTPWAVFTVEDVVYNVDVEQYIRAKGP
ncbi:MAG TPA: DUF6544 family protein [Anaerolineales bacterium]|jgi:hypothetical protein|nr:DUF6544 family protein [Anaerolineales bacterium]